MRIPALNTQLDVAIVGAGIVGLACGITILEGNRTLKVHVFEKESVPGAHASGRNSGVIHAGFYYSPDSLKAKFCKEGNTELKQFARKMGVRVNYCGKVVVATREEDVARLTDLHYRGLQNDVEIELLPRNQLKRLEPAAKTINQFIWSPSTAITDPKEVIVKLREHFLHLGGKITFDSSAQLGLSHGEVYLIANGVPVNAKKIINAGGAHSDFLARQVGVGTNYVSLPFRGSYIKSDRTALSKRLIYPVPHPINPFLGVHIVLTSDGILKVGPTAIPALGRENYRGIQGLKVSEIREILHGLGIIAKSSKHDIFEILKLEFPLLFKQKILKTASRLTLEVYKHQNWQKTQSGIRSQLVDTRDGALVQDFVVEEFSNSLHFLNIVSPGWTSALPFTRHFVNDFLKV